MLPNKKILIIDDSIDHLEVCEILFTNRGFEVRTLNECTAILSIVEEYMPDLIFIDHAMPMMTGETAIRMLKESENFRTIPVIYFSAQHNLPELAEKAGADHYVAKPFNIDHLLEVTDKYI